MLQDILGYESRSWITGAIIVYWLQLLFCSYTFGTCFTWSKLFHLDYVRDLSLTYSKIHNSTFSQIWDLINCSHFWNVSYHAHLRNQILLMSEIYLTSLEISLFNSSEIEIIIILHIKCLQLTVYCEEQKYMWGTVN